MCVMLCKIVCALQDKAVSEEAVQKSRGFKRSDVGCEMNFSFSLQEG